MGVLLAALATVLLVLAAAKAHGRQVRLEREARGHFEVDFRRDNHPEVEAIWRRDRWTLWPAFAALAAAALGVAAWTGGTSGGGWRLLPLTLAWAFAGAFAVAGLASMAQSRLWTQNLGWWLAAAAWAAAVAAAQLS